MHRRIGRLCERLGDACTPGKVVSLDSAFSALTADLIMERFYGYSLNYLENLNFQSAVTEAFLGNSLMFHFARFFPRIAAVLKRLPLWLLRIFQPAVAELQTFKEEIKQRIVSSVPQTTGSEAESPIIISALNDHTVPPEERTLNRLLDEGIVIIFAGTETSSRVISVAIFHLLNNKEQLEKLRDELRALPYRQDHDYSLKQLQNLPYLVSLQSLGGLSLLVRRRTRLLLFQLSCIVKLTHCTLLIAVWSRERRHAAGIWPGLSASQNRASRHATIWPILYPSRSK